MLKSKMDIPKETLVLRLLRGGAEVCPSCERKGIPRDNGDFFCPNGECEVQRFTREGRVTKLWR